MRTLPMVVAVCAVLCGCTGSDPGDGESQPAPTSSHRSAPADGPAWTALFQFKDPAIVESSGVVSSSFDDHVVFTHNDSGDKPRFFAVDFRGCTLARFNVNGAEATDWEDIAHSRGPSGTPTLWLGDIGDNLGSRASIQVYGVTEPRISSKADGPCGQPAERNVAGTRYDLAYPDGPHNAEALMADPASGRLYLVTKADRGDADAALYAAPLPLRSDAVNVLHKLATLRLPTGTVTGGDISSDGRRAIVRTYIDAYEWHVRDGRIGRAMATKPTRVALPAEPQGEAIGFTRDGHALLVTSEDPLGTSPPVYLVSRSK